MNIVFTTDNVKFANGKIDILEETEPYIRIFFTDILRDVDIYVKNSSIETLSDEVLIKITDSSDYFYDHQGIYRKKICIKFFNEEHKLEFIDTYNKIKKKCEEYKYYSNGTLKSRGNENNYEEYYNMPGYKLKFRGELDCKDNYKVGTFYNPRQNIQIDFTDIEENIPSGNYNIYFYDSEGEEVNYYEGKIDMPINVSCMNVDKFAEQTVPLYDEIMLRSETQEELMYRILNNLNNLKEEVLSLKENSKRTGWFY